MMVDLKRERGFEKEIVMSLCVGVGVCTVCGGRSNLNPFRRKRNHYFSASKTGTFFSFSFRNF